MTTSLKERLKVKQRPSASYPLAVENTSEAEAALEQARTAHSFALLNHGEDHADVASAKEAVEAAEKALADCYEHVTVRALAADDFEALVDAHPAQDEDKDVPWHTTTFRPALLEACVESDMSADDWVQFFKESGSIGDREGLYSACLEVNNRTPRPSVGKGSTPTIS